MTDEEHNNKAQELLLESNSKDSSPTNWKFEWDSDGSPPRIIDTEGKLVRSAALILRVCWCHSPWWPRLGAI